MHKLNIFRKVVIEILMDQRSFGGGFAMNRFNILFFLSALIFTFPVIADELEEIESLSELYGGE